MRQFVHHRRRRLGDLLGASVPLQAALREQAPGFEADAAAWLAEATAGCGDLGLGSASATLARLETEFALVTRGIDPDRGARVETYRRQFRQAGWGQAVGSAQQTLQEAYAREAGLLEDARQQLGRLLIAALQAEVVSRGDLAAARDPDAAQALWRRLVDSAAFGLPCRQILLAVIDADAALLTVELAGRLSGGAADPT